MKVNHRCWEPRGSVKGPNRISRQDRRNDVLFLRFSLLVYTKVCGYCTVPYCTWLFIHIDFLLFLFLFLNSFLHYSFVFDLICIVNEVFVACFELRVMVIAVLCFANVEFVVVSEYCHELLC